MLAILTAEAEDSVWNNKAKCVQNLTVGASFSSLGGLPPGGLSVPSNSTKEKNMDIMKLVKHPFLFSYLK